MLKRVIFSRRFLTVAPVLVAGLIMCAHGCYKPEPILLPYVLKLKPGITVEYVQQTIPSTFLKEERIAKEGVSLVPGDVMERMFTENRPVYWELVYTAPEEHEYTNLRICFDEYDEIIGFRYFSPAFPLSEEDFEKMKKAGKSTPRPVDDY